MSIPTPLTHADYDRFLTEVNALQLQLPAVVEWRGRHILVLQKTSGVIALTDISSMPEVTREALGRQYDPAAQSWVYHLPAELMGRVVEVADTAGAFVQGVGFAIPWVAIALVAIAFIVWKD